MSEPTFAVVGHPNKGKSSIVATLAQDDSVGIAATPGTTQNCRHYPMKVDGRVLYNLIDTPGFQRPRHALAWMQQQTTSAADHPEVVARFVEVHRSSGKFPDECELLGALLEGAGILYVVDGSRPYSAEYEAEMEILRWTGCPSMALINTIGPERFIDGWQAALGQYFSVVRRFDALTADFQKRIELLRAFGQLNQAWRSALEQAVSHLESDRAARRARCATEIADMLSFSVTRDLQQRTDVEQNKPTLIEQYKDALRRKELKCRDAVERIYEHHAIERHDEIVELLERDLFAQESWYAWGLNQSQMATIGAAGGGAVGAMVDASVGGSSFLLGTIIGVVVGGVGTVLTAERLAKIKILNQPMGGIRLRFGPTRNINFPHVLLGRARYHHSLVAERTHAQRAPLALDQDKAHGGIRQLSNDERKDQERLFARLRKGAEVSEVQAELSKLIESILVADAGPTSG
jgi:hypothetical protein